MLALITCVIVIGLALLGMWWLSGYDAQVTGEDKVRDFVRRALRCGLTLLLAGVFLLLPGAIQALPLLLLLGGLLVFIWCGPLTEMLARWFHQLIYHEDKREFDPNQTVRDLDRVASLIKNGQKEEAIQLCQALKESGDVSVLALETLLEHLGVKPEPAPTTRPLIEARRLRLEKRFPEAEAILNSLLLQNPANVDAAMMLMRLYAEDVHRPDQAEAVLESLARQPHVPSAPIEYARRSIPEWSGGKPEPEAVDPQPESIEELLARGYLGTAIEILERKIEEQPGDFDLRIKLAEVYGRHCGDVERARKIVRNIEARPGFSPEQVSSARTKLEEWRKGRSHRH